MLLGSNQNGDRSKLAPRWRRVCAAAALALLGSFCGLYAGASLSYLGEPKLFHHPDGLWLPAILVSAVLARWGLEGRILRPWKRWTWFVLPFVLLVPVGWIGYGLLRVLHMD